MFKDILNIIKSLVISILNDRISRLGLVFVLAFIVIIVNLFSLQVLNGNQFMEQYIEKSFREVSIPGTRGNIYDKDGNLLAYNELVWNITIQDSDDYQAENNGINDRNNMYLRLANLFLKYNCNLEINYNIEIDDDGVFYYTTTSDKQYKTFIANVYGRTVQDLDTASGKYPSNISAKEAFEYTKKRYAMDKITGEDGNILIIDDKTMLLMVGIHFTMRLTSFKKYQTTTIATNISDRCLSEMLENKGSLKGVEAEQSSLRRYNYAKYFANIIGYTGAITRELFDEYSKIDSTYTLRDTIGQCGIEKTMEQTLRGKTGYRRIYVDSRGKVLEVLEEKLPSSGNDVYLSISVKDQIAVYHLLEQQLTAIVARRLVNENVDNTRKKASNMRLSISDAYYQLINNNILDYSHFNKEDASEVEKEIYNTFLVCKDRVRNNIYQNLVNRDSTIFKELPQDMQNYLLAVFRTLVSKGIILTDKIDKESNEYKLWREDSISVSEYILKCIQQSWVDASIIMGDERYADTNTIYSYLINYVLQEFDSEESYDKLVYQFEIKNKNIPASLLIMALYDQGVLNFNQEEYEKLKTANDEYTFNYMVNLILRLQITAKDLAMDPCNGSAIITDVNTGKVKALCSYPSYDNNRITEKAYSDYLNADQTLPRLNFSTQKTIAPGSSFKPITAIASLEEGTITPQSTYTCTGLYEDIDQPLRCWVYPYSHNTQVLSDGIKNSCNCFFANLGHLLSFDETNTYSTDTGLRNLYKYAEMFGLNEKSGLEIEETITRISNLDPERSALGQGNHSFNNAQMAKYTTALANNGTVFDLSCLSKVQSKDGTIIEEIAPKVIRKLEFSDLTWATVKEGVRRVVTEGNARVAFSKENEVQISGKTGTAEERNDRGNHAVFISFAPSTNPQIAVNVMIPFGYSSGNAACLANSIYNYYYGYATYDQVISQNASKTRIANVTD
ncbi:MAG: penicillin-binding transpeptidase domain-containing protein [Eubacteriales bacterium]|nr:penicillin-binding transpeptidase domain-containing protein [Eubacteriales bacterium]